MRCFTQELDSSTYYSLKRGTQLEETPPAGAPWVRGHATEIRHFQVRGLYCREGSDTVVYFLQPYGMCVCNCDTSFLRRSKSENTCIFFLAIDGSRLYTVARRLVLIRWRMSHMYSTATLHTHKMQHAHL